MTESVESLDQLYEAISGKDVVVTFTQPRTCAPCRQLKPHLEKAAEQKRDTTFVVVDLDKVPDAVQEYGVLGVPTVKHFRDGNYVGDIKARTVVALLNELKD